MLMWMVRGKLNGDISACVFSIDTNVHVVVISMYKNVQINYCVIWFYFPASALIITLCNNT